ncbi:beta-1,3-glucosyltransferase-like [Anneissia japonica]|uniref:beta-1,3-glucosyltransferase-like n=1 Tax=Anneissia japonica TaxID=1529436 RepID=UPI00142552D6|nr:beta-1,3-glucosyltransferase-like [Anneissia japonica]
MVNSSYHIAIAYLFIILCLQKCFSLSYEPYRVGEIIKQGEYPVTISDIVFLIRSQKDPVHLKRAKQVRYDIQQQCRIQNLGDPEILLLSEDITSSGQWTILPILPQIRKLHKDKKWIFLSEEESRVSVLGLINVLSNYNWNEELFLGKALRDEDPTIIHHFRFFNNPSVFFFPDFEAGWLLSAQILKSFVERWEKGSIKIDFSIDVKHEIAYFLWDEGKGIKLTAVPQLCSGNVPSNQNPLSDEEIISSLETDVDLAKISDCVTSHPVDLQKCGEPVSLDDIFFGVKTCEKFHKDRVSVVQKTWGKYAKNLIFYSDVEDKSIPTVSTGVPNTERGHCGKLFAIFKSFHSDAQLKAFSWLVVTDDDTILSVARLQQFLSCYDSTQPVFLGERYGFGYMKNGYGYDYLTGGGGMIFSRAAIAGLLASGCKCRSNDDPDDMMVGSCARQYDFIITHTPLMHQARPNDYAKDFLAHQTPISFHKHWNNDPIKVYKQWFSEEDSHLKIWTKQFDNRTNKREEL